MDESLPMQRRPKRGIAILEFVLVMPVLFLTLLAAVQFASMMTLNSSFQATAFEAARLTAMECSSAHITDRVNEFLSVHDMRLGDGVRLVVEDASGNVQTMGDLALTSNHLASSPPAGAARAVLVVSMDATPAPNLLATYCLDFKDNQFELCATRHVMECPCP